MKEENIKGFTFENCSRFIRLSLKIFGEKNSLVKNSLSLSMCQLFSGYARHCFILHGTDENNMRGEFLKIIEELVEDVRNARGK